MSNPIAVLRTEVVTVPEHREVGKALWMFCPGCQHAHRIHVQWSAADLAAPPVWEWDGNLQAPTVAPSILVSGGGTCHSFVRGGIWEYLSDCTHHLAGQHVPLPPLPDWLVVDSDRR